MALWSTVVLFGATVFLLAGQQSRESFPSLASSAPSGTKLFGELLERNGLPIKANRSEFPVVEKGTTSVAFVTPSYGSAQSFLVDQTDPTFENELPGFTNLIKNAKPGSKLILIIIDPEFDAASTIAQQVTYRPFLNMGKPEYKLEVDLPENNFGYSGFGYPLGTYPDAFRMNPGIALSKKVGNTEILMLNSGLLATNRFIDRGDNAEYLVSVFRQFGGPNARFVSYESTFGNTQSTNLFSAIGNWALVASWQALLLFVVVCYSVSIRFGIAHPMRSRERGATDTIDAMGTTLLRTANLKYAAALYFDRIVFQAKAKLRIPRNAPLDHLTRRTPEGLSQMIESTARKIQAGAEVDVATIAAIKNEVEELNTSR